MAETKEEVVPTEDMETDELHEGEMMTEETFLKFLSLAPPQAPTETVNICMLQGFRGFLHYTEEECKSCHKQYI